MRQFASISQKTPRNIPRKKRKQQIRHHEAGVHKKAKQKQSHFSVRNREQLIANTNRLYTQHRELGDTVVDEPDRYKALRSVSCVGGCHREVNH